MFGRFGNAFLAAGYRPNLAGQSDLTKNHEVLWQNLVSQTRYNRK